MNLENTRKGEGMKEKSSTCHESGAKLLPVCAICHLIPRNGIGGGIRLKKSFICSDCETEIANLTADQEVYEEMIEKIKMILK